MEIVDEMSFGLVSSMRLSVDGIEVYPETPISSEPAFPRIIYFIIDRRTHSLDNSSMSEIKIIVERVCSPSDFGTDDSRLLGIRLARMFFSFE
jgi:hypothetical protein